MPTKAPYITPDMLRNAPTGINWEALPTTGVPKGTTITDVCWRATSAVDAFCTQDLRATLNTEQEEGPDFRLTIRGNGNARLMLSRFPVLSISSVTVLAATDFSSTPTVIPAGQYRILSPLLGELGSPDPGSSGVGPNAIEISRGWIDRSLGRNGYLAAATYLNGWPHAGLTADAAANAATLAVDDCTGLTGTAPWLYDGLETEQVQVLSTSVASGPGTVTLRANTANAHNKGVLLTTMPATVQDAAIKLAMVQAYQKSVVTIGAPGQPSKAQSTNARVRELIGDAHDLLQSFRRVV